MASTFALKMFSRAAGRAVEPGETVTVTPDIVMIQGNAGEVTELLASRGEESAVRYPDRCVIVEDAGKACSPSGPDGLAKLFARKHGIGHFFEAGSGNGPQILAEGHLALPGSIIAGTDDQTCTGGAFNAYAFSVSPGDAAEILAKGTLQAVVPDSCEINLFGHFQDRVCPVDLMLTVQRAWGTRKAGGRVIEFHGPSLGSLLTNERMTISALSTAMGAITAVFPADRITQQFLFSLELCEKALWSDADSTFAETIDINLDELVPMAVGPGVALAEPVSSFGDVKVNSIFIGTCAGGRVEDLKAVLAVMKGRHLARGVRMAVSTASRDEFLKALQQGCIEELVKLGATILPPGVCNGVWAAPFFYDSGDTCLATGLPCVGAFPAYTAGPCTAAAAAVTGRITDPRQV